MLQMAKTVIISEGSLRRVISEEYLNRQDLKNFVKNDHELEKKIKDIVADTVSDLFRVLWQRKNFYDGEIRK